MGVLMAFGARYSCNVEILGVQNVTLFIISKNIGGAIAPPLPTALTVEYSLANKKKLHPQYDIANTILESIARTLCYAAFNVENCDFIAHQLDFFHQFSMQYVVETFQKHTFAVQACDVE